MVTPTCKYFACILFPTIPSPKALTTDKEIEDGINEFKDAEKIPSLSVGDNKDGNSTGMAGANRMLK